MHAAVQVCSVSVDVYNLSSVRFGGGTRLYDLKRTFGRYRSELSTITNHMESLMLHTLAPRENLFARSVFQARLERYKESVCDMVYEFLLCEKRVILRVVLMTTSSDLSTRP